jgi:hypothetical protein
MKHREKIPLTYYRMPEDERLKPAKMPAWKFLFLVYLAIGGVILLVDIAADFSQRPSPRKVVPAPTAPSPTTTPGPAVR